ncbi:MAG: hypothetical protein K9L02_04190 [Acholeplasmataceae bacterium]|nr:hypothetical protein [Acholeplasmataceae bacterium]
MKDKTYNKYKEIDNFLEENNFYTDEDEFIRSIFELDETSDISEYSLMTQVYYSTIYTGYYEDYDKVKTTSALFSFQQEFYYEYLGEKESDEMPLDTKYKKYQFVESNNQGRYIYNTSAYLSTKPYSFISGDYYYKFVNLIWPFNDYHKKYEIYTVYDEWDIIYTGATRYVLLGSGQYTSHYHASTKSFTYRSYFQAFESSSAPLADITLIYDYMGLEKMYIESDDTATDFKISKEAHYSRNQFNFVETPYGNMMLTDLYPNESDIEGNYFIKVNAIGSYFHKLLPSNSGNTKYIKNVRYYDVNLSTYIPGSVEMVYDNNGNIESEDLVTFTFNFGVDESDEASDSFDKQHWIRDVYPYLVWGNSAVDYINHSAFERFVWDKDASEAIFLFLYSGRDVDGTDLTDQYLIDYPICNTIDGDPCIGNANGTAIPNDVINDNLDFSNVILYDDVEAPIFDYIYSKTISRYATSYYWANYITNVSDNSGPYYYKYELYDGVNYGVPGYYEVIVAVRDYYRNERWQKFSVQVI